MTVAYEKEKLDRAVKMLAEIYGRQPWLLIVGTVPGVTHGTTSAGNTSPENQENMLRRLVASFEAGASTPTFTMIVNTEKGS